MSVVAVRPARAEWIVTLNGISVGVRPSKADARRVAEDYARRHGARLRIEHANGSTTTTDRYATHR